MTIVGPIVWLTLLIGAQTNPAPSVSGTSWLCGPVTGRTAKDRDNALRFCSDEITPGVITEVTADNAVVRIGVTTRLADGMRGDRESGDDLIKKWLRWWCTVSNATAVTLLVESDAREIVRGSTSPDRGDEIVWPQKD